MEKTCKNCGTPITKEYCEDNYPEACEHWKQKSTLSGMAPAASEGGKMIIRRKNLTLAILVLFVMDMVLIPLEGHVIVRIVRFITGVVFYVLLCAFSFFEGVAADDDYIAERYCPYKTYDDLQAYEEADFECDGNCRECVARIWEE